MEIKLKGKIIYANHQNKYIPGLWKRSVTPSNDHITYVLGFHFPDTVLYFRTYFIDL